jgi:arginyl-tRNA synthetase
MVLPHSLSAAGKSFFTETSRCLYKSTLSTRFVHGAATRRAYTPAPGLLRDETRDPFSAFRNHVAQELSAVSRVPAHQILYKLVPSPSKDRGDLVIPVINLANGNRAEAQRLATRWASEFPESPIVTKPIATPNFLEFHFRPETMAKLVLPLILKEGAQYGSRSDLGSRGFTDPSDRKKVVVEFSSPNIAKPFHAGHLRSTIIGGFIANIYEAMGWQAVRLNYLGDWGRQFGLLAVGFKRHGDWQKLADDPIGHLYDVYVKVNRDADSELATVKKLTASLATVSPTSQRAMNLKAHLDLAAKESTNDEARRFFLQMEQGDTEALALWKQFRDLSITEYEKTYARLNIKYDTYAGESAVDRQQIKDTTQRFKDANILVEDNGALLADFRRLRGGEGLGKAVIEKEDGSTIYLSRDVSEAMRRYSETQFDRMVYVVASQQDLHMSQLFKLLEGIGETDMAARCTHVNFGMVRGMSTRKGNVKFLDDILGDAKRKMLDVIQRNSDKFHAISNPEETADILGITAVMIQDMKAKRRKDYDFSLERMTSLEGDTGPYLQYSHARLNSIKRRAIVSETDLLDADLSLLVEASATAIVRQLVLWPNVMLHAYKQLDPSIIVTYLFKLTHLVNASYNELRVVGSDSDVKRSRMALYEASRLVLNNGMKLLGLTPLDR